MSSKEREEINRILAELSRGGRLFCKAYHKQPEIPDAARRDIRKGKMSVQMGGSAAKVSKKGIIDIRRGRHPLLDPQKAVPLDIYCGKDYRTLVVTGPNTGG